MWVYILYISIYYIYHHIEYISISTDLFNLDRYISDEHNIKTWKVR